MVTFSYGWNDHWIGFGLDDRGIARTLELYRDAEPIFDRYGTSELVVSMTGCEEGRLHVDMEFGIVEVEAREETDEWVRGPLIVTGLGQPAAPMIRYRSGDLIRVTDERCACGSLHLRCLGGILSRVDDLIIVEGFNLGPGGTFARNDAFWPSVPI